jgi:hypothetical protein
MIPPTASAPLRLLPAWLLPAWLLPAWLLPAAWLLAVTAAASALAADELRFVRVNVSANAVQDLSLDGGRYLPMPLAEFNDLIARLGAAARDVRLPVASEARYRLSLDAAGAVTGSLEFELVGGGDSVPAQVSLGRVVAEGCSVRTADGTGEAAVYCLPDGSVAIRTTGAATYACDLRLPGFPVERLLRLPLVPALVTTVELRLPRSLRPIVIGTTAAVVEPAADEADAWRIVHGPVGPGRELAIALWDGRREPPLVRSWNAVTIRGRQAEVVARLEPLAEWTPQPLALELPAGMRVTRAGSAADGGELGGALGNVPPQLEIPERLVGSREPLLVGGMMPLDLAAVAVVPTIVPAAARWGGVNALVTIDPTLAIQRVQLSQCRAIARATGERWPMATAAAPPASAGIEPARLFLEYQAPAAEAALAIGPREAGFDVARVTTIDISPGTVLGRAAVGVRVVAGEVFELTAEIASGWFIDSVETVDWRRSGGPALPGSAPEWRVLRSPRGSELRIGLPIAATPQRSTGLRITGHRAGLPLGAEFSSDDMDMVRFPGETAMLEFQVGPTAVLEAVGGELGVEPLPDRLAPLSGLTAPRARIRAGERAPALRSRLVRRRPPVEADVNIELVARDDRLAETFAFTCRPVAGELDAVIIHFSEPVGPDLEWSLAAGEGGTLAAQLLDQADATRGELRSEPAVAESWLVELRPATTAAVTIRGSRTVPLAAAVPVTLAWVEAAEHPGGTVTLRSDAGWLPALTNRQLRELPPAADAEEGVLELGYGAPATLDAAAAATVAPPPATAAARAWAWRQATTCWCHDSGLLEWETIFEIENQGREIAMLTLPAGLRAEGVTVAGEAVVAAPTGPGIGGLAVPLPRASSRLRLVVRGSGGRAGRLGWWRVGGVACGIDMPVLDRETTLMLPPGVVLAPAAGDGPQATWAARLFGSPASLPVLGAATERGFQPVVIPGVPAAGEGDSILIRRRFLVSLTVITACLAAAAGFLLARRNGPAALAVCGAAAVVALWFPAPWDLLARGAFWAAVVGTWAGGPRGFGGRAAGFTLGGLIGLGLATTPVLAEEPPLRVYVRDDDGEGTALVPEPLLRRLAAAGAGPPSVRVVAGDITADVERGSWQVRLDMDADRGGKIVLDQGATAAVWRVSSETPRGLTVTVGDDGRVARIQASTAGRHRLVLDVAPVWVRSGEISMATVRIPPAPEARLRIGPAAGAARDTSWACDRGVGTGPWLPAVAVGNAGWDLAAADRVRLVRPADPRPALLTVVRAAVSFNDIAWRDDGCRLTATFDVGEEAAIVRSLIVRAAPGLEPLAAGGRGPAARPLGDDRFLIEIPEPRAGQQRIVTTFRMPLAEPVGVFETPFVWLESAEADVRTVRLRPAAELEADVELPSGVTLVRPREEDGPETTAVWRSDAVGAGAEPVGAGTRIVVRRRPQAPAVTQDLAVDFADDHVGLQLRCRLDAAVDPLLEIPIELPPAAIVDRISLVRERAAGLADAAGAGAERVDLVWSRESADRIVAVVQRPDSGRFRLQLDARLPIRPASRGRLPVARLAAAELPVAITWRAAPGMRLQVTPAAAGDGPLADRLELGPGASGPGYVLSREVWGRAAADEPTPQPVEAAAGELPGGPFTAVDLAIDDLGRAWGLVRFDLVARQPVVTLALPAGLRLFDVRTDGREVTALPGTGNTWEVRLHDVGWPRSLVAVFSGMIGSRLSEGGAIRLEPPRLTGLPAGRVVWSLDTPKRFSIRVSEPARILEPAAYAAIADAERTRFDDAFRLAVRQAAGSQRDRLDAFAVTRHAAGGTAGERAWYQAFQADGDGERQRTLIMPDADGSVTVRAVRADGGAAAGRGLVTAVILLLGLAGWTAVRRHPDRCRAAAVLLRRWWWVGCGGIWLVASQAILPGGLMLLIGIWLAWPRRDPAEPAASEAQGHVGGTDSTMTFVAK